MADIGDTIQAKSDQLNADDLIGGPIVIVVTRVTVKKGDDQPVSIFYENDNGKPWKPSKGMRRVLVAIWGNASADYVGRALRLYRNPDVQWAGAPVGGIQVCAASHIDKKMRVSIQVKKGQKAAIEVDVLRAPQQQQQQREAPTVDAARDAIKNAANLDTLERTWGSPRMAAFREQLQGDYDARKAALTPAGDSAPADDNGGFDAP